MRRLTNNVTVLFQRQVTTAALIVALVFLFTWVIPNQIIVVILIKFPSTDDGVALKLRSMMSSGGFEEQRFSTAKSLPAITAQLNSCLNFFVYAFRHEEFRRHLRLMRVMSADSPKTTIAASSVKGDAPLEGANVIRH